MTRALAFLVRNWPLKLAAIILATLLYGGLVLSENAQVWPGRVAIEPLNQPASVFLVGNLPEVRNIRYFAPRDVADRLSSDSFKASVDMADVRPVVGGFTTLNVSVSVSDGRVQVLDFDPRQVQVQLDPLVSKSVPVDVDRGTIPQGLEIRDPVVDASQVRVSGPESFVSKVTRAVARVLIQPAGVSIDQSVDLVAVDGRGEPVTQVSLEPPAVRVKILVGARIGTRSLPVRPSVVGTPGAGFEIASVAVSPSVLTVEGQATLLAELSELDTAGVSITGATADVTRTVDVSLPENIAAIGDGTVKVTVHLRTLTASRDFSVGITIQGGQADRTYALSTDRALVTVGGPAASLDALQGRTLSGSVDVSGLGPGIHDVPLRLALPGDLSLLAASPQRVRVTVSVPPTPTATVEPSPVSPAP
ncbi:MAG TPA: CdaR family protein [Candidatus Limnocylindrales bacterium]